MGAFAPFLPALLGAGAAIGGSLLSKKKDDPGPLPLPLNPAFATLLGPIFGSQVLQGRNIRGIFDDPNRQGILEGPEFEQALRDFIFGGQGLFAGEQALTQGFLEGNQPFVDLQRAQGQLDDLLSTTGNLVDTGFRTSAQPAFEEAERRLRTSVLPQIAETAGGLTGIGSSSFAEAGSRAGADLLGEAAVRQIGLNEAAATRRATAIPLLGNLIGTRLGLQPAFANDLLALGTGVRGVEDRLSGRPLQSFLQFAQLGNQQPFFVPGNNPQGSGTADLLGGLASALPGFLGAIGGAGGAGAGGPAASLGSFLGLGSLAGLGF